MNTLGASEQFFELEGKAWPDTELLRPFTCVPQEVGVAKTPWQWRGSVLVVPGRYVSKRVALLALTGKERRRGLIARDSPERELLSCDITALDLSGCDFSCGGSVGFGRGWKVPRAELVRLSLSYCNLLGNDLIGLVSSIPTTLLHLDLSGNHFGPTGARQASTEARAQLLQLETLSLGHCGLLDDGCLLICAVLRDSKGLERLELNANNITDAGCLSLGNCLLRTNMTELDEKIEQELKPDEKSLLARSLESIAAYASDSSLDQGTAIAEILCASSDSEDDEGSIVKRKRLLEWVFAQRAVACPPLRIVNISDNDIARVDVVADFMQACEHKVNLCQIAFHGNEVFQEALVSDDVNQSIEILKTKARCFQRQVRLARALIRDRPSPCPINCGALDVRKGSERSTRLHLELHCTASPQRCMHCDKTVAAATWRTHLKRECPSHPLECVFGCGFSLVRRDFENQVEPSGLQNVGGDHTMQAVLLHEQNECPRRMIPCDWGCGETLHAYELNDHKQSACSEKRVTCTFLIQDDRDERDELVPCGVEVSQGALEAHLCEHRAQYHGAMIKKATDAAMVPRDAPGAESGPARDLLGQLEKVCQSISLSVQDRSKRRKDRHERLRSECTALKAAMDRASRRERAEALDKAKIAVRVWREIVPRRCANPGCSAKMLERDLETHAESCPHRIVQCPNGCEMRQIKAKELKDHMDTECQERWIECNRENCKQERFRAKARETHERDFHTVLKMY